MAASIRLVGSLLRMEIGEGPEELTESRIQSAIVGLMMCRLGTMVPAETEVVLEIQIVNATAGVKEMDLAWLNNAALLCQRVSRRL